MTCGNKNRLTQRLIDLTNEWHDKVDQADQSILNMLFEHKWLELDFDYNHIVIHKHSLIINYLQVRIILVLFIIFLIGNRGRTWRLKPIVMFGGITII